MSDRARPGVRVLLVLSAVFMLLLSPDAVAARQTTDPYPTADELRARLDELRPQRAEAAEARRIRHERDVALVRSAAAAVATVDTIHVGIMTIITPVDQVAIARELFSEVWEESFSLIEESHELERARFGFQWSDQKVPIYIEEHARPIELSSRWIRRSNVKETIAQSIASTINFDLSAYGALAGRWVTGNPLMAQSYDRVYRMVATAQSRSTRACLDGEARECVSALNLTMPQWPTVDRTWTVEERRERQALLEEARREHLEHWYTPDERRSLAARGRGRLFGRATQEIWGRCIEAGDLAACDEYLLWQSEIAPLSAAARESFMAYALEQGGAGAWQRLLENPDTPTIEALEYASGQSIDDLAAGWIQRVVDHRPETFASLLPRGGLAVLWCVFFSAFALRSTRWRLG